MAAYASTPPSSPRRSFAGEDFWTEALRMRMVAMLNMETSIFAVRAPGAFPTPALADGHRRIAPSPARSPRWRCPAVAPR
jgi:hypothetical protein